MTESQSSNPAPWMRATCPQCGGPAARITRRDDSPDVHEATGTCKQGHIWMVKWHGTGEPRGEAYATLALNLECGATARALLDYAHQVVELFGEDVIVGLEAHPSERRHIGLEADGDLARHAQRDKRERS